jgi:hypothetical protein
LIRLFEALWYLVLQTTQTPTWLSFQRLLTDLARRESLASNETPISVTTLNATALERIQELLIRGERRQACHYALDEKLWAHAMVIASSIDRDAWQEVVKEFIRADLGSGDVKDGAKRNDPRQGSSPTPTPDGHESLRVAYSLFAGQGAASGIHAHPSFCGKNQLIFGFSTSDAPFPLAFTSSGQASATRLPLSASHL